MSKRSDFPAELPVLHTKYCFQCGANTVTKTIESTDSGPQTRFLCSTCATVSDRVRIWDPNMIQYFDQADELIHEGAGVVLQNKTGAILLFLRTKYPFLWTIPGGHMSPNEDPKQAALRELEEEVGVRLTTADLIFEGLIEGDQCMGGADTHKWYLYQAQVAQTDIELDEEGSQFAWFPLTQLPPNLTFPVQWLLGNDNVIQSLKSAP